MQYGTIEIDGFLYEFDKVTGALKQGWKEQDGYRYYYATKGVVTGEYYIDGSWYYFTETDNVTESQPLASMQIGFVRHGGHTYYYNELGKMEHGEKYIIKA